MSRLGRARPHRPIIRGAVLPPAAATAYTLTAPSPASGAPSVPSGDFTVTLNGLPTGTVVVTPSDSGDGGTFTPTTLSFSGSTVSLTFTYTPASSGVKTISTSDDGGLSDPSSVNYTATRTIAATFYVNATLGSDSNAGTGAGASAWQTMTKANSGPTGGYIAGDELTFDGTVSGNLTWATSGTQSARCTISGINTGTISCGTGTGVYAPDAEFVTVQDLTISGAGVSSSDGTTTSTGYGVRFLDTRTAGSKWRDVRVLNCTVTGTKHGIAFMTPTPDTSPSSVVGYEGVTARGCTVHDIQTDGIVTLGGTAWEQPPPYNNPSDAGVFRGVYVGYNVLYNVFGSAGVYDRTMWLDNVIGGLAERNVIHDCGLRSSGVSDNAQIMWFSCSYCVTQFCEAYSNWGGSVLDVDLLTDHCVIQYCYTHDNDGAGLMDYGSGTATTNVIRHCVSRNDNGNQDGASFRLANAGQYYGNTIISDANVQSGAPVPLVVLQGNALFLNNILVGNNGLKLITIDSGKTPIIAGNLYYTGNPTTANFDGTISTLAAWRAAGHETVNGRTFGVIGDPLLSNPSGGSGTGTLPGAQVNTVTYYDPASNSPAIGAGVPPELIDLTFGVLDYHGYPWYAGSATDFHSYPWRTGQDVDIGAVAYGASSLAPASGSGGGTRVLSSAIISGGW